MTEQHHIEVEGVRLHVSLDRGGPGRPVVILHGFTGSTLSMASVAEWLVPERTTLRVDLIGHGQSDAPDETEPYTMERCVERLAVLAGSLSSAPAHWLGYSMGGRAALSLATHRPDLVASLLLVGASPGLMDAEARRARVEQDESLANDVLHDGVREFVDRWMALPLFASQARLGVDALRAARRQRLANRPHGLAHSLRGMGAGAMAPLYDRLERIGCPVCLVVGDEDAKFRGLADAMLRQLANARLRVIPEAGHAAHLENPFAFADVAREFFAEVEAELPSPEHAGSAASFSEPACRP